MRSISICITLFMILLLSCGNGGDTPSSAPVEEMPKSRGEMVFDTHCTLCHGADGKLGIGGARDLSVSSLTKEEMVLVVSNGRGTMMPYRNILSVNEIEAVVDHVRTLGERE